MRRKRRLDISYSDRVLSKLWYMLLDGIDEEELYRFKIGYRGTNQDYIERFLIELRQKGLLIKENGRYKLRRVVC